MSAPVKGIDWVAVMRLAYRDLGLTPETLWSMSPSEFLLHIAPGSAAAPMGRAGFEELMARFPDRPTDQERMKDD